MDDDPDPEPWTRPPSGRRVQLRTSEPVPKRVQAVLGQRLFIPKEGLPAALITQLKRVAAFQNPMFYRKQAARLSTHDTPRVITCAKDTDLLVELPRACVDDRRNAMILDDVIAALEERRSPIVLTERVEHLEWLESKLQGFAKNLVVLRGGMRVKERRDVAARLASIPEGEERLLLATAKYLGEGFDDARLDTLFLTMPFAWKGSLVQYAGRLHRSHAGKTEVRVIDYVDEKVPVLARMWQNRLRGYRALGYEREGDLAANGVAAAPRGTVIPLADRGSPPDVGRRTRRRGRPRVPAGRRRTGRPARGSAARGRR